MQPSFSNFGRRSQPHQVTVTRGSKIRSFLLPSWLAWTAAGVSAAALAWIVGSTFYIAFNDEIYAAAKTHRVTVERAYEDRIAALRRQIDDINTRKFLDQQAFETRLESLLNRQSALELRHQKIVGLLDGARDRQLSIHVDQNTGTQATAQGSEPGKGLFATIARVAAFDPSRPAPLDTVRTSPSNSSPRTDQQMVVDIQDSIQRVETLQGNTLNSLESTVADLSGRLTEVSKSVGARLPEAALSSASVGGPLVELRRNDGLTIKDRQITRIRGSLTRFDALREHVSHLPVRSPLTGRLYLTSKFGRRVDPFLKRPAMHTGTDFRARTGTPVHASAGGRIVVAGYTGGYGRLVEIDHGNGYRTRYGHLSRIDVDSGGNVAPGDIVGLVGSSGRSSGPHLHYETRLHGTAHNPMPYINASERLPEGL